jgi:hypothetical protein
MIKHVGHKWVLYTSNGKKVLGRHDSYEEARKQEVAIFLSEKRAAADKKPKAAAHKPARSRR